MYEYAAKVLAVHDGDTISISLDLGFHAWLNQDVRLMGINAPELVPRTGKRVLQADGERATGVLIGLLGGTFAGTRLAPTFGIPGAYLALPGCEPQVVVQTRINKDPDLDKYGRVLARVWADGVDVCQAMIDGGFAVGYMGGAG